MRGVLQSSCRHAFQSVTAADGAFSLRADLSDKRKDLGTVWWHGCELLVTRPWVARDYDGERGHPLCVPRFDAACVICTEPLGKAADVAHAACCARNFHAACLERWHQQRGHRSCPMCRADA